MPQLAFTRKSNIKIDKKIVGVNDMTKGEKQYFDIDKYDIKNWQKITNMFSQYGNLRVRNGTDTLKAITQNEASDTVTAMHGLHIYQLGDINLLVGSVDDGTDTTIIKIDRTNGDITDLFDISASTAECDFANLRGYLYVCNESATIKVYDGVSDSVANLTGGISGTSMKLLTADTKRIWAVDEGDYGDVVYFSKSESGAVTDFSSAGTDLDRGGIANTNINRVRAMKAIGNVVMLAGDNLIELHQIPDFQESGITTFPAEYGTLRKGAGVFEGIGVATKNSVIAVNGVFYVMCTDGVLRTISPSGSVKVKFDVKRLFETYSLDQCALGYDQRTNNLYIATKERGNNDRVIVYNEIDESFSEFDNTFSQQFAFDENNVYCRDENFVVYDCFKDGQFTDDIAEIAFSCRSSALYLGGQQNVTELVQYGVQAKYNGSVSITTKVFADRTEFASDAGYSRTVELTNNKSVFSSSSQPVGLGTFGSTGFNLNASKLRSENYSDLQDVHIYANRHEIQFSGSTDDDFQLKAFNVYFIPTGRSAYNLNYSN